MTKEDYKKRLEEINYKASKEREKVHVEYANSNNPYKKGDILQDHCQIIIVEEIKYGMTSFNDECICNYRGTKLTKKLQPFKNKEKTTMFGTNVEIKLN